MRPRTDTGPSGREHELILTDISYVPTAEGWLYRGDPESVFQGGGRLGR